MNSSSTPRIHRAEDRGRADLDWLSTRYSFSFANWYDPARMGFGALRVINDDHIAPGAGFPPHSHRDMEIITLVTAGSLRHRDSMGNEGLVQAGEVQVMSAGTGVVHSEFNASETEPLELFQMWIETGQPGAAPRYGQGAVPHSDTACIQMLVAPQRAIEAGEPGTDGALGILQDAYIAKVVCAPSQPLTYTLRDRTHGLYAFVIAGSATVAGIPLNDRDALALTDIDGSSVEIRSSVPATILLFEVPV